MSCKLSKTLIALLGIAVSAGASAQAPAQDLKQPAVVNFNSCAKPHYPQEELSARHEGAVTLMFQVGTDGKVSDAKVGKSSGFPALDEAARSALANCQFQPAVAADGQTVSTWVPIKYVWTLK